MLKLNSPRRLDGWPHPACPAVGGRPAKNKGGLGIPLCRYPSKDWGIDFSLSQSDIKSPNAAAVCNPGRRSASDVGQRRRGLLRPVPGFLSTKLGVPQSNMAEWTSVPRASGRDTHTTSIQPIAAIRRVIGSVLCMLAGCGTRSKLAASSSREVHRNYVHRTRHYPSGKMYYAEMERIMSYQWDASKARRTRLFRLGCVIVATAASAAMPVYILVEAMRP